MVSSRNKCAPTLPSLVRCSTSAFRETKRCTIPHPVFIISLWCDKTGKPKHYAFIEFENAEVARIVAETMNGYFLYRKTLVVKVVPPEKLHPATFVGGM